MTRPVDTAMAAERPEKARVRHLWVRTLLKYRSAYPNDAVPLYLTLSGAEGRDIEALIAAGVVRKTQVGGIATEDQHIVVAIESNSDAVLQLQRKFPGLKILEQRFDNLLRSARLTAWPQGDDIKFCQARVVNLDLNTAVRFEDVDGELIFPPLQWIRKLCILHVEQRLDWCLLLTLHGEAAWESAETHSIADYLNENFEREPAFAVNASGFLGEELFGRIVTRTIPAAKRLSVDDQQKLLMVYVPKKLAHTAHEHGWRTDTVYNLRYGGSHRRAPMVTWIVEFRWDTRISSQPERIYRDSLKQVLAGVGKIAADGTLS
jgi:hypothetical protein